MTVMTIATNAGDCWGDKDGFGDSPYGLQKNGTIAYLGGTNNFEYDVRNWFPFVVNLPAGFQIISATVSWTSTITRSDEITAYIGCEDADNPTQPSSINDLWNRVQTTAKNLISFEAYSAGTRYSYDVTAAVQEILDRAGWSYGNTLAVLVLGNGESYYDHRRQIATFENTTYQAPTLEITLNAFRSRGVWF